jgi:hypothetical protein
MRHPAIRRVPARVRQPFRFVCSSGGQDTRNCRQITCPRRLPYRPPAPLPHPCVSYPPAPGFSLKRA